MLGRNNIDEFLNYRELYHDFMKGERIDTGELDNQGKKKYKYIGGKNKLITIQHYRHFFEYVMLRNMKIAGVERINENTVKRLIGGYLRHERNFTYKEIQDGLGLTEKGARNAADTKVDNKHEKQLLDFMRKWLKFEAAINDEGISKEPQRTNEFDYAEDYLLWLMLNGIKPERISKRVFSLIDREKSPYAKMFRKSFLSMYEFSYSFNRIKKEYSKLSEDDLEWLRQHPFATKIGRITE